MPPTRQGVCIGGKPGEGKIAYENFLALWRDADPDIPIRKQALAEYRKLQ